MEDIIMAGITIMDMEVDTVAIMEEDDRHV
jgi:hypothetical protein